MACFDCVIYLPRYASWENFHRRPMIEHLARALRARGGQILCVNRPVCPWSAPWLHARTFLSWLRRSALERKTENLALLTPVVWAHDRVMNALGGVSLNRTLLSRQIRNASRKLNFNAPRRLSWVYHPFQKDYLALAKEDLAIYECYDLYAQQPGRSASERRWIAQWEDELLQRVDVVFVNSERLLWAKRKRHPRVFSLYAAADAEFFERAGPAPLPPELNALPKPRIGFVGSMNEELDLELLTHVADERPGYSLCLIGPVNGRRRFRRSKALRVLLEKPNVHYLGEKPYRLLPSYLHGMDALLLPYAVTEYLDHVLFNKIFQYLATGKPVISTAFHEARRLDGLIGVAKDRESFVKTIDAALKGWDPQRIQQGRRFTQEHDWNSRVESCLRMIDRVMKPEDIALGAAAEAKS